MDLDPYAVLGVPSTATDDEIRRAYLRQVRVHHPDARPATRQSTSSADETLQRIMAAYDLLRDPDRRARYDRAHARADSRAHADSVSLRIPGLSFRFSVKWLSE